MLLSLTSAHQDLYSSIAYEIRQGTIEQKEAEREWVLSHYSRTAKKRSLLAGPAPRQQKARADDDDADGPVKKQKRAKR